MKIFANNRIPVVKEDIKSQFGLPNYHELTISNPDNSKGLVKVNNNLDIQTSNWKGDYFESVPVILKAIAKEGYKFSHWTGASNSTEDTIELNLVDNTEVTPHFIESTVDAAIVINEINYRSGDEIDPGDWIELYNPNDILIDVSNWILKDEEDTHTFVFPEATSIEANSYLVIVRNEDDFNVAFPDITNYIGEIDFGFGGNDAVRLFNENEVLQDEVDYDSDLPWPTCADGNGPTLELSSPNLDNSLPTSWECINTHGSPDAENVLILSVSNFKPEPFKVYPNPLENTSYLYIKGNVINKAEVYSIMGQKLLGVNFKNKKKVKLQLNDINSGVYLLKINDNVISKLIVK